MFYLWSFSNSAFILGLSIFCAQLLYYNGILAIELTHFAVDSSRIGQIRLSEIFYISNLVTNISNSLPPFCSPIKCWETPLGVLEIKSIWILCSLWKIIERHCCQVVSLSDTVLNPCWMIINVRSTMDACYFTLKRLRTELLSVVP